MEQVLGWNFKPFTLKGRWDDRYMGAGAAYEEWYNFEALIKRGAVCRFEFEQVAVQGLIKNVEFTYRRADHIRYQFEVSPHTRGTPGPRIPLPRGISSPVQFNLQAVAYSNDLLLLMIDLPGAWLRMDLFLLVMVLVEDIARLITGIALLIEGNFYVVAGDSFSPLSRVINAFAELRTAARALATAVQGVRADTNLIYSSSADVLAFEAWGRGLGYRARLLMALCGEAERTLARQVQPDTAALYRPAEGESLYGISVRFYNTAHHWRRLMEANGLRSTVLTGTELLVIPALGRTA